MAIPIEGNFLMFGTSSNDTIAGAIIEGGANAETVSYTLNFNALKGLADIIKFDTNYSEGATTLGDITKTTQFRGYPITGSTTTTSTTTLSPEGICRFIWASNSVDVERYGLRYDLPNTPSFTFTEFSGLPNEIFVLDGNPGFAYSVCSITIPQVWDFFIEEIVDLGADVVNLYNGGACSLNNQCDFVPPTSTTTTTTTAAPVDCYVYEYINTTENTTFSFGPYPLCPGPGDFDIQIAPGAEDVTFCIEQLSQETIDAFNAQGLILTEGASICNAPPARPATVVSCGTTYTSGLFEQSFSEYFRVPLVTGTGTSSYILDVAAASGAGTTGAIRFVITYNDLTVRDTGWVSRDPNANSVYLTGLNNLLTTLGYPTVASITSISSPISGSFNKNLPAVQEAFVEVFIYTPSGSTGNPFAFRVNCVVPGT